MKNVLVIAAHPDDEVIGCGGTIAKHKRSGDKIHLLYMTDGISSRDDIDFQQKNIRETGVQNFIDYLKPDSNKCLNLPDNSMDSISLLEIVKEIESVINDTKPDIIYTHSSKDLNIDHRITLEATLVAARPQNDKSVKVQSKDEIPLGHKIAMIDLNEGDTILKYGHDIGKVVRSIKKGEHVHVHNVKTKKW